MSKRKENVRNVVKNTIHKKELIREGEHIVIGLSGGPDSVCLFHVLNSLRREMNFSLYAVHVNHGFRREDGKKDQEYAESLCAAAGISCFSFVCDCGKWAREHGVSDEEAGRKIRYEKFLQTAREISAQKGVPAEKIGIAVAQNSQDQAETVLFRLLRGTGPDGLAGIAYKRYEQEIKVIRPLLDVPRQDIEDYCRACGLAPRTDKTNLEPLYTRNKIRLSLLPYLKKEFNENIVDTVNRLSKIAAEDKDYLWQQAENAYREAGGTDRLDLGKLAELHPAVRHRVILRAFSEIGLTADIGSVHLEAADRILSRPQPSGTAEFPGGFKMVIGCDTVSFTAPGRGLDGSPDPAAAADAGNGLNLKLQARVREFHGSFGELQLPAGSAVFDWDKISAVYPEILQQIRLRTRQPGDYIRFKNGRKKLQNFFVDRKIPREERDSIPAAAAGTEILWLAALPGTPLKRHRYSTNYSVDEQTKKVLTLEIICVT